MQIAAGRLTMGRCEALDGEGVTTHFFFLGPFFVPLETVYSVGHRGRTRAFQVRRHAKSIALAYRAVRPESAQSSLSPDRRDDSRQIRSLGLTSPRRRQ